MQISFVIFSLNFSRKAGLLYLIYLNIDLYYQTENIYAWLISLISVIQVSTSSVTLEYVPVWWAKISRQVSDYIVCPCKQMFFWGAIICKQTYYLLLSTVYRKLVQLPFSQESNSKFFWGISFNPFQNCNIFSLQTHSFWLL